MRTVKRFILVMTGIMLVSTTVHSQIIQGLKTQASIKTSVHVASLPQITDEASPRFKAPNKEWEVPNWGLDESRIIHKQSGEMARSHRVSRDISPEPDTSFSAVMDDGSSIPPDVGGAAGPEHLMTTLNTQVRIHDRQGSTLFSTNLASFWSALPGASNTFDPKVVYDPYEDRWIMTTPSSSNIGQTRVFFGVSATADPLGEWYMYAVDPDPNDQKWFDYPNLGFNKNWISVGGIMRGGSDIYYVVFAMDKMAAYNGEDNPMVHRFTYNEGSALVPAYTYDPDLEDLYFIATAEGNTNGFGYINKFKLSGSVSDPVFEFQGAIGVEDPWENWSYDNNGDFLPQLGTPQKLNSVDARMHTLIYRNNKLWAVHHIYLPADNPQRAAIQWWELDTAGSILQRGRVDDPSNEYSFAFPSIAVNANEDVFVGHGVFSENQYAGAGYSYRAYWDDPNSIRGFYQYKEGLAPYYKTFGGSRNRWGDYSTTCVDPINDYDFWALHEYAELPSGGDQWGTWWAYLRPSFPPIANFSSNVELLPVGETVDFMDQSDGIPSIWEWAFEGGTPATSSEQNPTGILFDEEGSYDVRLIVTNELGTDTILKADYITTSTSILPLVDFHAETMLTCVGDVVSFTDQTIYMPRQWEWQFDPSSVEFTNGTDQYSQNPQLIFNEAITYAVTLTAWNLNGQSSLTKFDYVNAGGYHPWFKESFEIGDFENQYWTIENPDDDKTWEIFEVGGNEPGIMAAGVNIRDYFNVGERDRLISPPFNLENINTAFLSFQYAYAQRYPQIADSLIVLISDDCGGSWSRIFADSENGSGNFATHELVDNFWPQSPSDWCLEGWGAPCLDIDISPWAGNANVQIAFETYSFQGNPIFVDNIIISQFVGLDEGNVADGEWHIFPNPNDGSFNMRLPNHGTYYQIQVSDALGKIVYQRDVNPSMHTLDIKLDEGLTEGIYIIKLRGEGHALAKKLLIR